MKKLSEVAKLVDLPRQRIQEYEKAGIAFKPKVKKNGYWLYDETEIERLWQIKFYLTLKLKVPEIKAIFADPNYNKHNAIADQIAELEKQKKNLESMIEIARAYNEMDVLPSDLRGKYNMSEDIPYGTIVPLVGKILSFSKSEICDSFSKSLQIDLSSTEDAEKWSRAVLEIAVLWHEGNSYKDEVVQKQLEILNTFDAKIFPNSWIKQYGHCIYLVKLVANDIREAFGDELFLFIQDAVSYYYIYYGLKALEATPSVLLNHPISKFFFNIDELARNEYTTGSTEVQAEVDQLHKILNDIGIFTKKGQLELLSSMADSIGCKSTREIFDSDRDHGICWFISRAIEIYCNHQQEAMEEKEENNE